MLYTYSQVQEMYSQWEWEIWFAWHPIKTNDGSLRWLVRVKRRKCWYSKETQPHLAYLDWEYEDLEG